MSLINQMLRDLEQRQQGTVAQASISPVDAQPVKDAQRSGARKSLWWGLGLLGVSMLVGFQGPAIWQQWTQASEPGVQSASEAPVAMPTAVSPPVEQNDTALAADTAPTHLRTETTAPANENEGIDVTEAPPTVASNPRGSEWGPPTTQSPLSPAPAKALPSAPVQQEPAKIAKQRRVDPAELARQALQQAQEHRQRGQTLAAIDALKTALSLQPTWTDARVQLIGLYQARGQWNVADQLLVEAMQAEPSDARWPLMRAKSLWQQADAPAAITVLEQARATQIDDENLNLFLAALYQRTKQHAASAALYQDILARQQGHGKAWLGLAISLQAMQQPRDALAAFQQALRSGGHEPKVQQYIEQRIEALRA